jgi:peptide/nickel transport system substrate-binding protein
MNRTRVMVLLSVLIIISTLLASCSPAAATPAPTQPAPAATEAPQPVVTEAVAPTTAPTVAATTAPQTGAKTGGRIVYANTEGYYILDPILAASQSVPHYATFDPLITLNLDLTDYVGILAEKFESAPDNMSATFTLRKGLKFQDGTPVDAQAIKWNLDQYRDPKVASPFGGWMAGFVSEIQAPDPLTVVIKMEKPYAPLYYWLAQMGMVSPTAYQKLGTDKFVLTPVGAGPWIAKEITPDVSTLFVRNTDYAWWPSFIDNKGPAYADELMVRYAKDESSMFAGLETGETHVAKVPSTMLSQAKSNPNIELVKNVQAGESYLGMNTQDAVLSNKNIRLAIGLALNRDEIVQVGYGGEALPMYGVLSPTIWGYSQKMEDYAKSQSNDPAKAKEMLAAEGYKAGADGMLVGKDGKKLEIKLALTPDTKSQSIAETIQSQLKDIGVSIVLEPVEESVIIDMTKKGTHQMILWSYGLSDASILSYLFQSNRIGASNRTRFNNPELDKLMNAADGEMNPDLRRTKVEAVMQLLIDNRPMIPLYAEYSYMGYRKDLIAGLKFDKVGGVYFGDAYLLK